MDLGPGPGPGLPTASRPASSVRPLLLGPSSARSAPPPRVHPISTSRTHCSRKVLGDGNTYLPHTHTLTHSLTHGLGCLRHPKEGPDQGFKHQAGALLPSLPSHPACSRRPAKVCPWSMRLKGCIWKGIPCRCCSNHPQPMFNRVLAGLFPSTLHPTPNTHLFSWFAPAFLCQPKSHFCTIASTPCFNRHAINSTCPSSSSRSLPSLAADRHLSSPPPPTASTESRMLAKQNRYVICTDQPESTLGRKSTQR